MSFDLIVVGGGHAGIEAVHIASQFSDLKIGLLTLPGVPLGSAPCNPAVGGVGKGQLVREIDAMGGICGRLADLAGIQFRTLNDSKGHAVQSTRIQIDKIKYSEFAEECIQGLANVDIIYEKLTGISLDETGKFLVSTESSTWNTKSLIVTVGTFLAGKLHVGEETTSGGRRGVESSAGMQSIFSSIRLNPLRFKTGTPPRLARSSVETSVMVEQPSDPTVDTFHFAHKASYRHLPQQSCYLTATGKRALSLIRANKERSPMYNGQIKAVGARYCPSIEDKAYRYPDKDVHHVFVEPEGVDSNSMYPSGISSSLPKEIQDDFVKTISGLENAVITEYGYAVEYDVIDTTALNHQLEYQDIPNLYFAGQVNGTSGYEEAAAQGLVAGIAAALKISNRQCFEFSREDSYIGVLVEDLITNSRDEPYRLFTARCENRLFIREDNAVLRMAKYRRALELKSEVDLYNGKQVELYEQLLKLINEVYVDDRILAQIGNYTIERRMSLAEYLRGNKIDPFGFLDEYFQFNEIDVPRRTLKTIIISNKYSGYIEKQTRAQQNQLGLNKKYIDWKELCSSENISFECKQRIESIKPKTFGQLRQIVGIRHATLAAVAGRL